MSQNVAFIVYSLAERVYRNALNPSDENWNLNASGSKTFVNRAYSWGDGNRTFDDQLLWVSSYALISRMVVAGALP